MADEPTDKEYVSMTTETGSCSASTKHADHPAYHRIRGVLPDRITIFKGPHERICATHAQMVEQIRKTVLHELGHYFGFDDKYLHSHGY